MKKKSNSSFSSSLNGLANSLSMYLQDLEKTNKTLNNSSRPALRR